ncbi:MAG TPA: autotransporter-associated beta strand repeat-containing protein, partial [Paludibacter sp.]|nr:autotransporter-associated beta strand repeat-containing protein [Paludibacter sp.]
MKKTFTILTFLAAFFFIPSLFAQRPMEKLDRSVVAQKVSNGVYVNWRIPSDEWYNTAYKLYRDGSLIYTTTSTGASNYLDAAGTTSSKYTVSAVKNGVESTQSAQALVLTKSYLEIPMRNLKSLGKKLYYLNDATAADLDGDGQYEVIIKRMNRDWDAANTNFTYFEAYKMDGTFMWAIDVGPNITMDVEINIAAFDFDGDGKSEVFMRSSDNTIFGLDKNNQNGTTVGDRDKDGVTNYRYSIGGDGFINAGPEYLSLIDGMTGKELDWVNFIPRGTSGDWGDDYGHRANKFFFGAPYLDGKHPSLFIGRGIYTQTKMRTYDIVNKKLVLRWSWESGFSEYAWQGNHNYTIADTDYDGKDEIVWGSMCVDDNGTGLYSTGLGHGDALHVGDFDPYRKGTEVFACNEANPGTNLRDGKTGQLLYRKQAAKDVGRACAGNISDSFKGAECWGGGVGISATDRVELSHFGVAENYCVYWDGDLLQEILDHSGFSTGTGVGYGAITKFNGYGNITTLLSADANSCNYTKGTPCLQADLIGDWREEAIWWRADSMALRVYTTPIATTNRIYTLMHDHQYRQAICWQMCGYNQPPHTSFYLGSDFPTPIPAKSTNGKLVWKGSSATLDASASNFMSGDDAAGLIDGTAANIAFSNGKSILLDNRGVNKTINLTTNIEPELFMVSATENYSISGSGELGGSMMLDKMGESTLTINGNHTYTGKTDIWEGNLWLTGSLTSSAVTVRRHANFGGIATLGNGLTTEYNAGIFIGGQNVADTMKITGNLNFVSGAKLVYDLSDNPNVITGTKGATSTFKNDYLQLNGTLQIGSGAIILINQLADSITPGKYLLMKANAITGTLSTIKVQGVGGKSVELTYDATSKELFLVVKGTRSAGKITWTGKTDANWNLAKTANWKNDGFADIFVANDSVYLDATATSRTINLVDSLPVAHLEVNSNMPYTFGGTGVLTGSMSLIKAGTGSLTLNTRNNYTGKTIVEGGSLIMKYAPSSTNNGGIGTNSTLVANFVVKDSSIVQITTANEITNRGLTLAGAAGGLLNVTGALYWNGGFLSFGNPPT